jgi:hypothetical protein
MRVGPYTNIYREPEGWSLRVTRRGRIFSDYFGDAVYGSRAQALRAAQHCRDRLLLQRVPADTRVRRRSPRGRRSKTGVPGVTREKYRVGGRVYSREIAHWPDPDNGPQRRRFAVKLCGARQARAMAIEARRAGLAECGARLLARQREEARRRLQEAGPMPRRVKDPRSRRGISMARRRPRRNG